MTETPVSPELLPADANGNIAQVTEDLVGPYELHDFFLHAMLRHGFGPDKILMLADKAFAGKYDRDNTALAENILPQVLLPAVQTLMHARRSEGGKYLPFSTRRLENALRRDGVAVAKAT